jgi:hypothetical protein
MGRQIENETWAALCEQGIDTTLVVTS